MQQQQPTHPGAPCPVCGAEPQYRTRGQTIGYGHVSIRSKKHSINGTTAQPLVCTVCGYVQLFVNPGDFRD